MGVGMMDGRMEEDSMSGVAVGIEEFLDAYERSYKRSIRRTLAGTRIGVLAGLSSVLFGSYSLLTLPSVKMGASKEVLSVNHEVEGNDRDQAQIGDLERKRNIGLGLGIGGTVLTLASSAYGLRTIRRKREEYNFEMGE